jgi:hypothetical protein
MMPDKAMIGLRCAIAGTNWAIHGTDSGLQPDFEDKPV